VCINAGQDFDFNINCFARSIPSDTDRYMHSRFFTYMSHLLKINKPLSLINATRSHLAVLRALPTHHRVNLRVELRALGKSPKARFNSANCAEAI
jgi:hypothetical protein